MTIHSVVYATIVCLFIVMQDIKPGIAAAENIDSGVQFTSILTAKSNGALEGSVVAGGSWFSVTTPIHQAIYIKHPKGDLLFDSGLGTLTQEALSQQGWLDRQLFAVNDIAPVKQQLLAHGMNIERIKGVIPSHLHWDHTGGIPDLNRPVWVQPEGLRFALDEGEEPAFLKAHLSGDINWQPLTLNDTPYQGFNRSLDIYQDGTLVLVGLEGHTPGQVGLFINLQTKRYFFIGDTTWSLQGVSRNAPRPGLTQWLTKVDYDYEANNRNVELIHSLAKENSDIIIVPAHDPIVYQRLPHFPEFSDDN